jgi:hypothetical protein
MLILVTHFRGSAQGFGDYEWAMILPKLNRVLVFATGVVAIAAQAAASSSGRMHGYSQPRQDAAVLRQCLMGNK